MVFIFWIFGIRLPFFWILVSLLKLKFKKIFWFRLWCFGFFVFFLLLRFYNWCILRFYFVFNVFCDARINSLVFYAFVTLKYSIFIFSFFSISIFNNKIITGAWKIPLKFYLVSDLQRKFPSKTFFGFSPQWNFPVERLKFRSTISTHFHSGSPAWKCIERLTRVYGGIYTHSTHIWIFLIFA